MPLTKKPIRPGDGNAPKQPLFEGPRIRVRYRPEPPPCRFHLHETDLLARGEQADPTLVESRQDQVVARVLPGDKPTPPGAVDMAENQLFATRGKGVVDGP